ncbi:MAG: adenylate/guanylate cyclase domain-containing protein [Pseudomonadota bacterium]
MPRADEWIDTTRPPGEIHSLRRQRLLRLSLPILTAVALSLALLLITRYVERSNRDDALQLAEGLIGALETAVQRDVDSFLSPPAAVVSFIGDVADEGITGHADMRSDADVERALRSVVERLPTVSALFIGNDDGDFLMVQRREDGLLSKFIANDPGDRVVRVVLRNAAGDVIDDRLDPEDDYDPRTRGWFADALAARGGQGPAVRWSEVYPFFTTGAAGVTASTMVGVRDPDTPATVAGADLQLATVNQFLGEIELGHRARIAVISTDGRVIALPEGLDAAAREGAPLPLVGDLDDRILDRAFQHFRIERQARDATIIDGERYVVSSTSLSPLVGRDWWLLIVVPEETFIGFVRVNARTSLLLSAGVVILATIAAFALTWQGVVSDRRVMRAVAMERDVRDRGKTLRALGAVGDVADPNDTASVRRLTELLAEALDARRVGVWRLDVPGDRLMCLANYDRERHGFSDAAAVPAAHLGDVWPRLVGGEAFDVLTARDDEAMIVRYYLKPSGTDAITFVPIAGRAGVQGTVSVEDGQRADDPAALGLLQAAAAMLVPRLVALNTQSGGLPIEAASDVCLLPEVTAGERPPPNTLKRTSLSHRRDRRLLRSLDRLAGEGEAFAATMFPRVAVMTLQFGDDMALASGRAADAAFIGKLIEAADDAAERLGVPCVKLLGDQLVVADGMTREAGPAIRAVADLALDLQPICREACVATGRAPLYRFGLDIGSAAGAFVGDGGSAFNLWGDAVRIAGIAAARAQATTIQVTESVYDLLGTDYLLRPRGSFYLNDVGLANAYVLAGRL